MYTTRLLLALVSLGLLLSLAPAAAPPAGPSASDIGRWITELGGDTYAVREAATNKLRAAGAAAEPMLEKALASKDAEVLRRVNRILDDFKWGIYPDTPRKVVELIRQYQSVSRGEKRGVIQRLMTEGMAGCRAIVKIARAERDELVRKEVFADVASVLVQGAGSMIEEGNVSGLEALIQLAVEGNPKMGARHFAAYYLLTGQLPKRIDELEARALKNPPGKIEAEVLAYLYRAKGDLARAAKAAADAELSELQEGILYQKADWKTLAHHPELTDTQIWIRFVGLRAAYTRLAGESKGYDAAVKDIIDRARPLAERKDYVVPYAKALFLNARPDEAIDLLKKSGQQSRMLFDILAIRLQYKAAFELVETARAAKSPDLPGLEIAQARVLYDLGEKDRALALLARNEERIKAGIVGREWCLTLVEVEKYMGRHDEAIRLATKVLVGSDAPFMPRLLFEKLFPDQDDEAMRLWDIVLRMKPGPTFAKVLPWIQSLVSGKATAAEIDALIADVDKLPPAATPARRQQDWLAVGEAALLCKQNVRAEECFRKAGGTRGQIRRGDLLAAKKRWLEAASCYRDAYRRGIKHVDGADPSMSGEEFDSFTPLALYLYGDALVKAGQEAEGRKRIEQSHLLPLGSGDTRYYFAKALKQRGHAQAARREYDLIRRVGDPILMDPEAFATGEGLRAAAQESSSKKDYLKAADGYEQAFLRCLHPEVNFYRSVAYVSVPAHIHHLRALGLATAGKLEEAKAEARCALDALPGNVEVALKLVPLFDERKQGKEGDDLFASVLAVYEAIIRDYPKHVGAYNQAAWLTACCRRKLDTGLVYARKAVALAPKTAAYHDTLAEVLFQLGKQKEALAAQKQAVTLDPKRAYFRKQLKRIEAGDPRAPRPEEEDE